MTHPMTVPSGRRAADCLVPRLGLATLGMCAAFAAQVPAAPPAALPVELPLPVRGELLRHRIPFDSLSAYVQNVEESQPLLAYLVEVPRNPASVMKIVTTLVALDVLGPGHRWKTEILVDGPISKGNLDGNLVLKGGGDPFLVTEKFWKLLRRVRARGVRRIRGDLMVDGSYFRVGDQDPGAFDRRPHRAYNALPHAMLVNYKATRFSFRVDRDARKVAVWVEPPATTLELVNQLKLVDGRCAGRHFLIKMGVDGAGTRTRVRFTGKYPRACGGYSILRAVLPSSAYVFGVFDALWTELGGAIDGRLREARTPHGARRLLVWRSDPLSDLIRSMNKHSNNVMTRQLMLTLGAEEFGAPGTVEKGRDAIAAWLSSRNIRSGGLVVDNGAGLSRDARISAATLGEMLLAGRASPLWPELAASLPLSAVDGTLEKRFRDGPLAGRMHLKTGLIDHVRAAAGYLMSRSGETYVVAILHNYPGVHGTKGKAVQDALLEWIYDR